MFNYCFTWWMSAMVIQLKKKKKKYSEKIQIIWNNTFQFTLKINFHTFIIQNYIISNYFIILMPFISQDMTTHLQVIKTTKICTVLKIENSQLSKQQIRQKTYYHVIRRLLVLEYLNAYICAFTCTCI